MNPIYLGIVGQIASGKGEVVKILTEQYGFVSFNLSSILHKILDEKGITNFTRADLQDLGDKLRMEEGEGVLAKRAIKYLCHSRAMPAGRQEGGNSVSSSRPSVSAWRDPLQGKSSNSLGMTGKKMIIEGIRNPAEVNYLRTLPNFQLIAVKAKKVVRFDRLKKRGKPWDPKTWGEFLIVDRRDKGLGQKKYGQQVGKCVGMANMEIQNNGDIKLLISSIIKVIEEKINDG